MKHARAGAVAESLTLLFAGQENCRFAADPKKNAVVVMGTQDQQDKIEKAVRSLDVAPGEGS